MTIQQLKTQTAAARYQQKLKADAEHAAWMTVKIQELNKACEDAANAGNYEAHMVGAGNWNRKQFADIKQYYKSKGFSIKTYSISWK